ncbi:hypothetical protein HU200_027650 [Digitaria exilis]|uniref:Uncharacterized protein n=1 Tax=Digitaria exilis TaxID=1010633 RepID=A0A835ETN6_9POAL|nr:hypothetical protein HU200_027650 [Digitaria exilis]
MMVVDGCFLLAVMAVLTEDYPYEHGWWTHGRMLRIMKDILLFENQIPWVVTLVALRLRPVKVESFVADIILAYFDLDGPRPPAVPGQGACAGHRRRRRPVLQVCNYARAFAPFTSAVELAEAGIHLQGSGTCRVTDVRVEEDLPAAAMARLNIGRLVLPRLALCWLPRCWLINMVALAGVRDGPVRQQRRELVPGHPRLARPRRAGRGGAPEDPVQHHERPADRRVLRGHPGPAAAAGAVPQDAGGHRPAPGQEVHQERRPRLLVQE